MNIAIVGLAFSHPYTYTQILQTMGHRVTHVWDDDPQRLAEFCTRFGATAVTSPTDVPRSEIDGVIATSRFPERIDHALLFIERGVPVYMSKPMAANPVHLEKLGQAVRRTGAALLSTSVLRYAPVLQALRSHLSSGALGVLVGVRAVSAHRIDRYMSEPDRWQDDPERGGGTIINMGVHALEMLSVVVGCQIQSATCWAGRRFHVQSLSEDVAMLILRWEDGLVGTAEIVGGVNTNHFEVQVYGSNTILKGTIPTAQVQSVGGTAVGLADKWVEEGYAGTMAAFIEMCRTGQMPVPLEESETIARVLLAARASAASGLPVRTDTMVSGATS